MTRQWLSLVAASVVFSVGTGAAPARERLLRRFGLAEGLDTPVLALAQDARGFLWIGTNGGLLRWDGSEFRHIDPTLNQRATQIATDGDEVYVAFTRRDLRVVAGGHLVPVLGPNGRPIADPTDVAVDRAGTLWVAAAGHLWRRPRGGAFARLPDLPGGERSLRIEPLAGGGLAVASTRRVWRLRGGRARPWLDLDHVLDMAEGQGGTLWVVDLHARIHEVHGSQVTTRGDWDGQGRTVAMRGNVAWVSLDSSLVRVEHGRAPEVIGARQGITGGGPILVDREGSVWIGTNRGLYQLPEPETAAWDEEDGLRDNSSRFLVRGPEGLFVATWGFGWSLVVDRLDSGLASRRMISGDEAILHNRPCVDGRGVVYGGDLRRLDVRAGGIWSHAALPGDYLFCAGLDDGAVVGLASGLVLARGGTVAPLPSPVVNGRTLAAWVLHVDRRGLLWLGSDETVCRAPLALLLVGAAAWDCGRVAGMEQATVFADAPSGALWLGSAQRGVLIRSGPGGGSLAGQPDAGFREAPQDRTLPGRFVWALAPSPRGGMWIGAPGVFWRVREPSGGGDGWEVVERIGTWQGDLVGGAGDIVEDPDGTLWAATAIGVVEIPPSARFAHLDPPPVSLTDVRIDGRRVAPGEAIALPYGENHLELDFSALTYRDPRRLRYRLRLGQHLPWSQTSATPRMQLVDVPPGHYTAEVEASFDGAHWSAVSSRIAFTVAPPWWRRTWLWMTAAALIAAGLLVLQRARMAVRLRLERQRLRIAMDLHDEVGSGLGSIGILSDLAARGALPEAEQRRAADRIASTAGQLGSALTDILWSLRGKTGDLSSLFVYLRERAEGLFAGADAELEVVAPPEVPPVPLSLAAQRAAQRIALEALSNAARHARATRVILGAEHRGRSVALWVEDDGRGLGDRSSRPGGGFGLDAMRRRAGQVGASLAIGPGRSGRGTRVELVFDPRAEEHHRRGHPA